MKVYSTEPVMHDGQVYLPGEEIEADVNDAGSIISAGRGTMDAGTAKTAAKQYAATQQQAAKQAQASQG
jgi:hypothetical protein